MQRTSNECLEMFLCRIKNDTANVSAGKGPQIFLTGENSQYHQRVCQPVFTETEEMPIILNQMILSFATIDILCNI